MEVTAHGTKSGGEVKKIHSPVLAAANVQHKSYLVYFGFTKFQWQDYRINSVISLIFKKN